MSTDRRSFFTRLASAGAGLLAGVKTVASQTSTQVAPAEDEHAMHHDHAAGVGRDPFETPDLPKLAWKMVDGVKEFHLIAEVVRTEFMPGRIVDAWGYNGSVPGPTIEVDEGDAVRIVFENRLPEITTVHWHGLEVPIEMDGVPGLTMDPVQPGGTFVYEFTLHQHGTFFYHSHMPMQEMLGMLGFFIIHPKERFQPAVDRDFGFLLQGWALLPNNTVPNTLSMEFNWLTLNGKAGPATTPVIVKQGERVRLRFVNLGMDHHPMHLHGHQFYVTGTEGGRVPEAARYPGNTVIVGVAQARDVEFEAQYLGDWMLHCHLPHHMMNQMVSMVGPMSHMGSGLQTGAGMEEGMGMIRQGHALSEELGPALGRGLGEAATRERNVTHMVGQAANQQSGHQHHAQSDDSAKQVPGFPQDMWMVMDEMFVKPETYGLRKDWTAAMMGMMTLVRVVAPELYDEIAELKKQQPAEQQPGGRQPIHQHQPKQD